jgi:hypothetical protein
MLKTLSKVFAIIMIAGLIYSCGAEIKKPSTDEQTYYYPVNIGREYTYTVDTMFWDYVAPADTSDTISYQIREVYDTDYPDNVGDLVTRVIVKKNGVNWSKEATQQYFNSSKDITTAERIKNNIRYIMLRFPIAVNDTFNRNQKNNLFPEYWFVSEIGGSYSYNGTSYSPTMTIYRVDEKDSLHIKQHFEVYAHNVGLVYKEHIEVTGKTDFANWWTTPVLSRIEKGFKYTWTMTDYKEK